MRRLLSAGGGRAQALSRCAGSGDSPAQNVHVGLLESGGLAPQAALGLGHGSVSLWGGGSAPQAAPSPVLPCMLCGSRAVLALLGSVGGPGASSVVLWMGLTTETWTPRSLRPCRRGPVWSVSTLFLRVRHLSPLENSCAERVAHLGHVGWGPVVSSLLQRAPPQLWSQRRGGAHRPQRPWVVLSPSLWPISTLVLESCMHVRGDCLSPDGWSLAAQVPKS